MANSYITVPAMHDLHIVNLSAYPYVTFDKTLNFYKNYSHGQTMPTYIQLNMSKAMYVLNPTLRGACHG